MTIREEIANTIYATLDHVDQSELNQALKKLEEVDQGLALDIEAAVNLMRIRLIERAFILGWQMRQDPSTLLFDAAGVDKNGVSL